MGFAAPSRLVLEVDGRRIPAYVTNFETGCVWLLTNVPLDRLAPRMRVRLTVRDGDGPALGLRGQLRWLSQDRLAVGIDHPADRMIIEQWRRGRVAEIPDDQGEEVVSIDLEPTIVDALSEARPPDSASYAITVEEYVPDVREPG